MEFPVATQRLYGEVSYKTVGVKAICSVFAWLGMHAPVQVFLFSATGFLAHNLFLSIVSLSQVGWVSPVWRALYLTVWQRSNLSQGCAISKTDYWINNSGPIKLSLDSFSFIHPEQWKTVQCQIRPVELFTGVSFAKTNIYGYETTCWQLLISISKYEWECIFLN